MHVSFGTNHCDMKYLKSNPSIGMRNPRAHAFSSQCNKFQSRNEAEICIPFDAGDGAN